jgi:hypothetical protein
MLPDGTRARWAFHASMATDSETITREYRVFVAAVIPHPSKPFDHLQGVDRYREQSARPERIACKCRVPKRRRAAKRAGVISVKSGLNGAPDQDAAARGARLRELRWKNSAWLATAETIAGWNGFEIRNAGSGRSPVRKRSG